MANIGQTMFRFAGACVLAGGAVVFDHPDLLIAPTTSSNSKTVPVVVASRDIPEGAMLDREALTVAQWPEGVQPVGAYQSVESVVSRVARVRIYKGEVIVPNRLAPEGAFQVKITPGKRAYGIRVDDTRLADVIQPNSRVDIMVVMDDPANPGKRTAKLFMTDMRVLAIGALTQRAQDGRPMNAAVASIEVTPEEAERLAIAAAQGSFQLVLRSVGNADSVTTHGTIAQPLQPRSPR